MKKIGFCVCGMFQAVYLKFYSDQILWQTSVSMIFFSSNPLLISWTWLFLLLFYAIKSHLWKPPFCVVYFSSFSHKTNNLFINKGVRIFLYIKPFLDSFSTLYSFTPHTDTHFCFNVEMKWNKLIIWQT